MRLKRASMSTVQVNWGNCDRVFIVTGFTHAHARGTHVQHPFALTVRVTLTESHSSTPYVGLYTSLVLHTGNWKHHSFAINRDVCTRQSIHKSSIAENPDYQLIMVVISRAT